MTTTEARREIKCPRCGNESVRLATKHEQPAHWLAIRAYRKCETCGLVFQPISAIKSSLLMIGIGVLVIFGVVFRFELRPSGLGTIPNVLAFLFAMGVLWDGCRQLYLAQRVRRQKGIPDSHQ